MRYVIAYLRRICYNLIINASLSMCVYDIQELISPNYQVKDINLYEHQHIDSVCKITYKTDEYCSLIDNNSAYILLCVVIY